MAANLMTNLSAWVVEKVREIVNLRKPIFSHRLMPGRFSSSMLATERIPTSSTYRLPGLTKLYTSTLMRAFMVSDYHLM